MSTDNRVSMHNEKRKAKMQLKQIVAEMLRDEKTAKYYDNERRVLDTSKTKDNVVLVELEGDIDALRKKRIEAYNKKAKEEGKRRLREDANDAITTVLQLSKEYCETHSDEEIIDAYKTMIEVMQEDPDEYGEVVCAVLHMDESTPHVQLVRLTVDVENLQNKNADMYGRTPKAMSHKQTDFAERLQKKGLNVTRGRNRVSNTFQKEAREFEEATGLKYDRLHDDLFEEFKRLQKEQEEAEEREKEEAERLMQELTEDNELNNKMCVKDYIEGLDEEVVGYDKMSDEGAKSLLSTLSVGHLRKLVDARREQEEELEQSKRHQREMAIVRERENIKDMYIEDLTDKDFGANNEVNLVNIGSKESQEAYIGRYSPELMQQILSEKTLADSGEYLKTLSIEELRHAQLMRDTMREAMNNEKLEKLLDGAESTLERRLAAVRKAKSSASRQKRVNEKLNKAKSAKKGFGPEL